MMISPIVIYLTFLYFYDFIVSLFPEYNFPLCLRSGSPEAEPDVVFRRMCFLERSPEEDKSEGNGASGEGAEQRWTLGWPVADPMGCSGELTAAQR